MNNEDKTKNGYYIMCILHKRRCHKTICKKCYMEYCDEWYTADCPDPWEDGLYHPAKDERDLPPLT